MSSPAAIPGQCVGNPGAVAGAAPGGAGNLPESVVAGLDAAAQEAFKSAAAPGAIVGVRTPQGTWTAAYGLADPSAGTPMTTKMHTRIGSVTKTFTGTLLLQLAEEGKLDLDEPIEKYHPGIPNGDRISLRMLANMTSGVASFYTDDFLARYFGDPAGKFTTEELIDYGISASPVFAPGEKFNYSNTNTILLGLVIEEVAGRPFPEVLQQRILTPLGLAGTSWPGESDEIPEPHPRGFTLQGLEPLKEPVDATHWTPTFAGAAGALISTVDDLLVYNRALGTGQGLLSPETQAGRLTSFPSPAGYGLALGCIGGWVGHTGELPGFNTALYYDTTADTSVVVMVNSDIASGGCAESPTLSDDPGELPCSAPATRIFVGLSKALGHEFTPVPSN
ncbi:serine hydrolase domain-containing protein [Paeniglutamicibacter sp. R2-26]|uniref:serine hydrolase domain-containing protein n=1 Tax=Paeniglutamicibacter sp. R2-26 TaxID=3144417 RepID=UPI003EE5DC26